MIVFGQSLLVENQWHRDHSINQTLTFQQHSLKLSILELIPLFQWAPSTPHNKYAQLVNNNSNKYK